MHLTHSRSESKLLGTYKENPLQATEKSQQGPCFITTKGPKSHFWMQVLELRSTLEFTLDSTLESSVGLIWISGIQSFLKPHLND